MWTAAVTTVAVRPANAHDADWLWSVQWRALASHVTDVLAGPRPSSAWFAEHHDGSRSQIIVVDGRDAGFIGWHPHGDHWYLARSRCCRSSRAAASAGWSSVACSRTLTLLASTCVCGCCGRILAR